MEEANAQALPLEENSVDLIVTSPPYAANAIDYMRSHKFVLVWLGHAIEALGTKRNDYIGGDATEGFAFENVPRLHRKSSQSWLFGIEKKHACYNAITPR